MEHVRQIDLIRLSANELAGQHRAEVKQHLAACPACRTLYQQQAVVWRAMGEWTPQATPRDLLAGVDRKLGEAPTASHRFWSGVGRISRIAAAIVIGLGAGYGAARSRPDVQPSPPPLSTAEIEKAAAEALGIQYFEELSPAGLYAALDDMPADGEVEVGQP